MGFFRSVMFALGLTAAGLAGCEESSKPPVVRYDAGIDARVDAGNNGRRDAARPHDTGYQHNAYDAGSDAQKEEDAYDATKLSDAYDTTQLFDAHDAQQQVDAGLQNDAQITDAQRIEDVFDAAREAGYDAQRADAHDAAYADAQSDAGNSPVCPPGEQRAFYNGPDGTVGIGNCRAGLEACLRQEDDSFAYEIVREEVLPQPERCNNQDDDCNQQIDEGVKSIFYRDDDHDGYGTELDALQGCQPMEGYVRRADDCNDRNNQVNPDAPELCDQRQQDNNCDGAVNEGCECLEAEVRSCASDEGECESGLQICDFDGIYSPCVGARGPEPERCDGKDNSCDGQTDEIYELGVECLVGVGACERSGVAICAPDGLATICSAQPGQQQAEKCDGSDADCDGVANNGYDVGAACNAGIGVCRAEGVKVCDLNLDARVTRCDAPIIEPLPEVCADGIDQDCTGEADDDPICNSLIAYICNPNGDKDVCVIRLDGHEKTNLTNHPAKDWNDDYPQYTIPVSWSPDRQWIAFISNREVVLGVAPNKIYRVNIETRETQQIRIPEEPQVWDVEYSPDGTHIAYISQVNSALKVINLETEETLQIDTFLGAGGHIKWLPDSLYLAYKNVQGLSITKRDGSETRVVSGIGDYRMIEVSPDGTKVLSAYDEGPERGSWNVYLVNLQTGERRQEIEVGPRANEILPRWLPDSTRYVVMRELIGESTYDLFLKEGDQETNLTNNPSEDREPTVSPDGRYVAFVTDRHGTKDLYKVEVATGIETRLTDDPGDEEAPIFAPVAR